MVNVIKSILFSIVLSLFLYACSTALSSADNMVFLKSTLIKMEGATGSVVIGKSGTKYVLTNWHVCALYHYQAKYLDFVTYSGIHESGAIVASSPTVDLCALSFPDQNASALRLTEQAVLEYNTEVDTVGYPQGYLKESHGQTKDMLSWSYEISIEALGACPLNVKNNVYSTYIKSCTFYWNSVTTTLYAKPGSSGSPVINSSGQLVGVITSEDRGDPYKAGMVQLKDLRNFLDKL